MVSENEPMSGEPTLMPITHASKQANAKPNGTHSINGNDADFEFHDLPPFPSDVPAAPLLRITLRKLLDGDESELDRLWQACCELGFFYLDLRDGRNDDADVDGDSLLKDAYELFSVGEKFFALPIDEKVKYDFKDQGSYHGYKGYGSGIIDKQGNKDRNEFYNVSKEDILGITDPLPAPDVLTPYRSLLSSYIKNSHAIVDLILNILSKRLDLPPNKLNSIHRLSAASGDQVRWVHAPPQPEQDRRTALGAHTDFGSVTILFNRLGGLQVLPPKTDEWCYVKPLKGHAVVNLGDAMVKLSAGILRSNIHRVVNPPGEQTEMTRMSLVYFARPEEDVLLKALTESKIIAEKKRERGILEEEEITSKEWILRRALGRRGNDWSKTGGTEDHEAKEN